MLSADARPLRINRSWAGTEQREPQNVVHGVQDVKEEDDDEDEDDDE